ncbi:MAG: pimeloyl-ACP methyl ester esterase BioH [Methylovulum sp.]|uniref:pimeloyl-ACP methyl ester esterase BioH n=1 Tax=Methylovulum sp. TaxID=1916980 RepID=UPI00261101B9|nr:pimeloyl-ACP methyl ester esterase BioH [Methylovulum sp.]MDD2723824.1 pimeloyl-ACP methyl ester esterase BioH [Methylovulum sp.]MDD5123702.1 pimeloyl-ACP methyl ester esterase BioH [Methylovulum sp.]
MQKLHHQTLGSGKPIVLIHGWGMHSGIWQDFAEQLASHHRVTLVDLPGHGHSDLITPFTLENISDMLAQTLPDEPCCWLGWSLGSAVALEMARCFPERVNRLVLVAGNPCFLQQDDWAGMRTDVLDSFAANLQQDTQATLTRFLAIQVMTLPNAKELAKSLKTAVLSRPIPDNTALQGGLDILKTADMRPALAAITVPVLVVLGKKDSLVPAALSQHIPDCQPAAQVCLLEHAAHTPFLSHPEEMLILLKNFMENQVDR